MKSRITPEHLRECAKVTKRLAELADCDERTALDDLAGQPTRPRIHRRLAAALTTVLEEDRHG